MEEVKDSNIAAEEKDAAKNSDVTYDIAHTADTAYDTEKADMDTEIKPPAPLTRRFMVITLIAAGLIVVCGFILGVMLPKSDTARERGLYTLEEKDKEYVAAKKENDEAVKKNEELQQKLEEKQKDLDVFHSSRDNLDKITESNSSLESERDILRDEAGKKQSRLDSMVAAQNAYEQRTITWTSGDYTVGKDIASGQYMITGTGSIAVAKNGRSRVNKMLTSGGELLTLTEGERIRVDGSAKLVPQR